MRFDGGFVERLSFFEGVDFFDGAFVLRLEVPVEGMEAVELGFELEAQHDFLLVVGSDEVQVVTQFFVVDL